MSSQSVAQFGKGGHDTRFTKVLAVSFALATLIVVGLAWQTWRAARDHRVASERVLRDYASFAAWSFKSRVNTATFLAINPLFDGAQRAIGAGQPILLGMLGAADSIERCQCAPDLDPQFVFAMDLASVGESIASRDSSLAPDVIRRRVETIRKEALSSLRKGVRSRIDGALPYGWIASASGDRWIAFYSARFRSADDLGMIVGFEITAEKFAERILSPSFSYVPLLPPSLMRSSSSASLMSLNVSSRESVSVFRMGARTDGRYSASEPLGERDTAMIATVAIDPNAANQLIIGGIPASPVVTVFPLVSLAVALLIGTYVLARRRETQSLEVRASLSEARLASLRAQIHPHFLFNVLNSIVMLARKGDNKAVVGSLTRLSDLLRVSLRDAPREEVELRDELELARQYLELEQVRFQDRLTIEVADPGGLATALVPTLILQPLVENAVRHGIGAAGAAGIVKVSVRTENQFLLLEVRDNGRGVDNKSESPGRSGIGLSNSRERLRQLYGEAASLNLTNMEPGGTLALVTIPLKWNPPTVPASSASNVG